MCEGKHADYANVQQLPCTHTRLTPAQHLIYNSLHRDPSAAEYSRSHRLTLVFIILQSRQEWWESSIPNFKKRGWKNPILQFLQIPFSTDITPSSSLSSSSSSSATKNANV